jgi:hypothetical protein
MLGVLADDPCRISLLELLELLPKLAIAALESDQFFSGFNFESTLLSSRLDAAVIGGTIG